MRKLNYKLALAPMAGVTDHPFRRVCLKCGAEITYTEMLSAKAIHFKDKKTASLGELFEGEPTAVQLFGSEPDIMAEAAGLVASCEYAHCKSKVKPLAIDINMGCPAPKVANNGEGSALLKNPLLAEEIVRQVKRSVDTIDKNIPVSVKIRIGWDNSNIIGVDFAKRMEAAGADLVTVHGRTREGRFSAPINFTELERIKTSLAIPMVANGEIFTAEDAVRMFDKTGCDAIMLGRGVMGNPWLFSEIKARIYGEEYTLPTDYEKIMTAISQLDNAICEKGEKLAVLQSRGQLSWYLKGIRGSATARANLNNACTREDVISVLMSVLN